MWHAPLLPVVHSPSRRLKSSSTLPCRWRVWRGRGARFGRSCPGGTGFGPAAPGPQGAPAALQPSRPAVGASAWAGACCTAGQALPICAAPAPGPAGPPRRAPVVLAVGPAAAPRPQPPGLPPAAAAAAGWPGWCPTAAPAAAAIAAGRAGPAAAAAAPAPGGTLAAAGAAAAAAGSAAGGAAPAPPRAVGGPKTWAHSCRCASRLPCRELSMSARTYGKMGSEARRGSHASRHARHQHRSSGWRSRCRPKAVSQPR